jgi:hypothetical protein
MVGLAPEDFAGHALRAGFLTSGAEAGASIFKLMEISRHTLRTRPSRAALEGDDGHPKRITYCQHRIT